MSQLVERFKEELRESILDPEGAHHQLSSGLHGRKLDFDLVIADSDLSKKWVEATAAEVKQLKISENLGRVALMSVANGTNRLVPLVAQKLGEDCPGFLTEKLPDGGVWFPRQQSAELKAFQPELALVMDDVGTTGQNSLSVVIEAWSMGIERVEVLNTWQRRPALEKLEDYEVIYHSLIYEPLPDFTPEECAKIGYCAEGWELIARTSYPRA